MILGKVTQHPSGLRAGWALIALLLLMVGCGLRAPWDRSERTRPGRIVLVGSDLRPSNNAAYEAIAGAARGEGAVAVLTEGWSPRAVDLVEDFARHVGPGNAEIVHWRELVEDPFSKRYEAYFLPEHIGPPLGVAALEEFLLLEHRGGATIAGAGVWSNRLGLYSIERRSEIAQGQDILCEPVDDDYCLVEGLGLFSVGSVEYRDFGGAGVLRLLDAMDRTGTRQGFAVARNRAVVHDPYNNEYRMVGDQAFLILDGTVGRADQSGPLEGLFITLLGGENRLQVDRRSVSYSLPGAPILSSPVPPARPTQQEPHEPYAIVDHAIWLARAGEPFTDVGTGSEKFRLTQDPETDFRETGRPGGEYFINLAIERLGGPGG